MSFQLKVIRGKDKGKVFTLKAGVYIGRASGGIVLSDPKISSEHAIIESDENGVLYIKDLGSANGMKINNLRIDRIQLLDGMQVELGRTLCLIREKNQAKDQSRISGSKAKTPAAVGVREAKTLVAPPFDLRPPAGSPPPAPALSAPVTPPAVTPAPVRTASTLENFFEKLPAKMVEKPKPVGAFRYPIEIRCTRGLQADMVWVVGYGPRLVGARSLDICILNLANRDLNFELAPQEDGSVRFSTATPLEVRVNSEAAGERILESGDRIDLGDTELQVVFKK